MKKQKMVILLIVVVLMILFTGGFVLAANENNEDPAESENGSETQEFLDIPCQNDNSGLATVSY